MIAKYNGTCKVTGEAIVAGETHIVNIGGKWQVKPKQQDTQSITDDPYTCHIHSTESLREYTFASPMYQLEGALVNTFSCGCATCIPIQGGDCTHHSSYGSAADRATMIKQQAAINGSW